MKQFSWTIALLCAGAFALPAGAQTPSDIAKKPLPPVLDPAAIDQRADPCADFYQFACGAWVEATPVPPDRSLWWRNSELDEHTLAVLATILEEAAAGQAESNARLKMIGNYYASCMDEAAIEAKGLEPFKPEFERIAALNDKSDLAAEIAHLHVIGAEPLFWFSSAQDYTDATMMIAGADQGGFALPDRDYYLTGAYRSEREDYRIHLERMFGLLGDDAPTAKAEADAVMRVETALAEASMGRIERREPSNVHHKMTLAEFEALTPSFDWNAYLSDLGAPSIVALDVSDPDFFKGLDAALNAIPLEDWKSYLRWNLIDAFVLLAPKAFVDQDFAFFGKRLGGQREIAARWKRCVGATDSQLGDALGEAYVARAFSPKAKERVLAMLGEVVTAMSADIETLDWMSAETKKRAQEKLAAVANKIGYPDKWIDYSTVEIVRGDALGNAKRAAAFDTKRELAKIGKPVDRGEWSVSPPTNNAYYDPQMNEINFPAGILQPPNFDLTADDAVIYGSLASVIGHELTHGFDDEGRHYDGKGNLVDWWTEADAAAFEARAAGFVDQYSAFVAVKDPSDPAKDVHVDGKLTLGENTADNGGIRLAYDAFMTTQAARGGKDALGYTPAQRFFLSYAQSWCVNRTNEYAKEAAKTDPHSPGKYRVNGVLANLPAFREAFSCKVGTPMAPARVNRVW
jgi:endothelin-converting enzyme/putative endopeptidase